MVKKIEILFSTLLEEFFYLYNPTQLNFDIYLFCYYRKNLSKKTKKCVQKKNEKLKDITSR
jgi:hypothetical protein